MKIGPNQEKWLQTLESGKYEQGIGGLCRDNKYCCLGVAADIFGCNVQIQEIINEVDNFAEQKSFNGRIGSAPELVINVLKLRDNVGVSKSNPFLTLASLNDIDKLTFNKIAEFVRKNPKEFFTSPN